VIQNQRTRALWMAPPDRIAITTDASGELAPLVERRGEGLEADWRKVETV
jgi:hypothetical protein